MQVKGQFVYDYKDGSAVGDGQKVIFNKNLDAEKVVRRLWCRFLLDPDTNMLPGQEAWAVFYLNNAEQLRIPLILRFGAGQDVGFGLASTNFNESIGPGTLRWSNKEATNYVLIPPFDFLLTTDRVTLESNCGAGNLYALIAVLSSSPLNQP